MAIPVYLFLTDDGGAKITGSVDVYDREGSIEVTGFTHNLRLPTDALTGKITGKRNHAPIVFQKEIDSSSPYLMISCCDWANTKNGGIQMVSHKRCRTGSGILQYASR